MSVVTIFSGVFCRGLEVAQTAAAQMGYELVDDQALAAQVSQQGDLSPAKLIKAMTDKPGAFNKFTHEKERAVAALKIGMSQLVARDRVVYLGHGSHLVPASVSNVLRVCLIADLKHRAERARQQGLAEKEALARIHKEDEAAHAWVKYLRDKEAWASELYDILLPMDKKNLAEAVNLIVDNAGSELLASTPQALTQAADFQLAARVEMALVGQGHDIRVTAKEGKVLIEINKKVLMLSRLEEDLLRLARAVPGVGEVRVKVGPGYYQSDIYRQANFEMPAKVLLVDDEREFVQTLSERLLMREIGSAVVYDGQEALNFVKDEEPEVMVLDLKMPGIDGIEVLRRLKKEHPGIEVIILTGHGSEADREMCMQLGAFAYLKKPVDIDVLSQTMREAYAKIRAKAGQA
ncbi:MAG: response regulator [Desulfarculus sp.]|nr:response regulator [Desulfarculus sp.]